MFGRPYIVMLDDYCKLGSTLNTPTFDFMHVDCSVLLNCSLLSSLFPSMLTAGKGAHQHIFFICMVNSKDYMSIRRQL